MNSQISGKRGGGRRKIDEEISPEPKKRRQHRYTDEDRVVVIQEAEISGNRAAGRKFGIAESTIREWRKNEEKSRRIVEEKEKEVELMSTSSPATVPTANVAIIGKDENSDASLPNEDHKEDLVKANEKVASDKEDVKTTPTSSPPSEGSSRRRKAMHPKKLTSQ